MGLALSILKIVLALFVFGVVALVLYVGYVIFQLDDDEEEYCE